MVRSRTTWLATLALGAVVPGLAAAQLRPARLFGDGMVVQRGVPVPVWGTAAPGASIVVTLDERPPLSARADAAGGWRVVLPAMPAGGPHEIAIAAGAERVTVRDVLVGDVWVASGQSNMEWTVADANGARENVAGATDRHLRHFKVPTSWAERPETELAGGAWAVASPATVGAFSAVGYEFARALRERVDVPIGILNTTWGGSRIEPWMSREALGFDAARWDSVQAAESAKRRRVLDRLRARLGTLPTADAGMAGGRAAWADPALDDASWTTVRVPSQWESAGWEGLDGIAWYRATFTLTAAEAAGGVRLGLGAIDDSDVSWVNGVEVGRTDNAWNVPRVYAVPAVVLRAGRNVIAVRVEDFQGGGGIAGPDSSVYVEVGGARRPLAGDWRFRVAVVKQDVQGERNQVPTLLFNKMIHPLLPFPIRGAIWYQGESNAYPEGAVAYRAQFPAMIRDWRRRWGVGDFPFFWVSLAGYMAPDTVPATGAAEGWALLREAQHQALALPATGEAVAIDVGEADDIHPRDKRTVGRRLALQARRVAYGESSLAASGPTFRRQRVEGGRVVVELDHLGGGLTVGRPGSPASRLGGFAVAGADGRWVWAEAEIRGDAVVVWSERVPAPVAVRYAWGNNPTAANLFNRAGLPAAPFRTDAW